MPEAILVALRVELPIPEFILRRGGGESSELGYVIAKTDRRLAEVGIDQRMGEGVPKEFSFGAFGSDRMEHLVEGARRSGDGAFYAFRQRRRGTNLLCILEEALHRARWEGRAGREDEILRVDSVPAQLFS